MTLREAFEAFHAKWVMDNAGKFPSSFDYFCAIHHLGAMHAARECVAQAEKLAEMANNPDSVNQDRRSVEWRDWNDLCPASMLRVRDAIRAVFPEAWK